MNELQNLFLGANIAVVIRDENEFNKLKEWMGEKNLFLANKEPVSKMQYPGSRAGIYRNVDDLAVYWSPVNDLAGLGYKSTDLMNFLFSEKVIEANAEVIDEVTNLNIMDIANDFEVMTVKPAEIDGANIEELASKYLPMLEVYKNTIVTKDNVDDISKKCTELNKVKKAIEDKKASVMEKVNEKISSFITTADKLKKACVDTREPLWEACKSFEKEEKEALRKEIQRDVDDTLAEGIERGELTQEYANKFKFDETWLNKTMSRTKVNKEILAQIKELAKEYKRDKNDLDAIVGTINSQNIPEGLMPQDKYIRLYQTGTLLPDVLKLITEDGIKTRESIENEKKKAVEEAKQTIVKETVNNMEQSVAILKEDTTADWIQYFEDTTGKLLGHSNGEEIKVKIQPEKNPGKLYRSIYAFEGDFASLKTFTLMMKILMKINKTFKRKEIKVKESPVLISKDKEGNYIIEEIKKEGNK